MNEIEYSILSEEENDELWQKLNWKKISKTVIKMQRRITYAFKEKNYRKLAILQWLLTRSFCARALAVYIVVNAKGSRTTGVDYELWLTDRQKYHAIMQLQPDQYKPNPYKRVHIPKSNGGTRPLSIPTMADRAMQTLYKLALEPVAECNTDKNSFAYRYWRGTHDALAQCRKIIRSGAQWVIEGDIKSCFDSINHTWLLNNIPMEKSMLRRFLKCGHKEKSQYYPPGDAGISQGSPLSPILCNLTLDGFRDKLKRHNDELEIIRYADDFVIFSNTLKSIYEALPIAASFLKERGLSLSPEKTVVTSIQNGFDFLGFNFRIENGVEEISPSTKSVDRVLAALKKEISHNANADLPEMVKKLNAIIRGWANYHRYCNMRDDFDYIDTMVKLFFNDYGIDKEHLSSIILASKTPNIPYVGMHPKANPFEVSNWGIYFEKWEYDWGY